MQTTEPGTTAVTASAADAAKAARTFLSFDDVCVRFGGIVALDGISFDVPRLKVCGLIGPNGAGKTTLFNCLSRLYDIQRGDIRFEGESLLKTPVNGIAALGIARTFQNLALFKTMSVRHNIMLGAHSTMRGGFFANAVRLPVVGGEEQRVERRADELIDFLKLEAVAHRPVSELPFGTQKRVELARALASTPRLLLLDEPAAGLNHEEVDHLRLLIRDICDRLGVTVLLVEHHMNLIMRVSDKVVALNFGRKIADGTPAEVQQHPEVIRAYLGASAS